MRSFYPRGSIIGTRSATGRCRLGGSWRTRIIGFGGGGSRIGGLLRSSRGWLLRQCQVAAESSNDEQTRKEKA